MENSKIYDDIAKRTNGTLFLGVVGPVRTGKSTFIKRFMEYMVIPNIDNMYKKERAKDELPQSGSGRTIMTAEPKFIPEEAATINVDDGICSVRLVDCVGYMVDGALGDMEGDMPRMVATPWSTDEMTMKEASEIGTKKVITEHSTVGIVVTTDGSVTDIEAENYVPAENRVISELIEIGKPFTVIVNTNDPNSSSANLVKKRIFDTYGIEALCVNCMTITENEINAIMKSVLLDFPINEIHIKTPSWLNALPPENEVKSYIYCNILESAKKCGYMRDIKKLCGEFATFDNIKTCNLADYDLATGISTIEISMPTEIFYDIINTETGFNIKNEADLIPILTSYKTMEKEYSRFKNALDQVYQTGYGIVMPSIDELTLEEPEIIKQGSKYGVKLRANAPSIHLIRSDIESEISPVVGSEKQSEELINYMLSEFEDDPSKIWSSNIFGKSLHELVNEGLNTKLNKMPDDARQKIRETLTRIINEGSGGLICIIL